MHLFLYLVNPFLLLSSAKPLSHVLCPLLTHTSLHEHPGVAGAQEGEGLAKQRRGTGAAHWEGVEEPRHLQGAVASRDRGRPLAQHCSRGPASTTPCSPQPCRAMPLPSPAIREVVCPSPGTQRLLLGSPSLSGPREARGWVGRWWGRLGQWCHSKVGLQLRTKNSLSFHPRL